MATKGDLTDWVIEALKANNGTASILFGAQHIWSHHESELRESDLFFSWQYDMRWAATELRKKGRLVAASDDRRGKWTLT